MSRQDTFRGLARIVVSLFVVWLLTAPTVAAQTGWPPGVTPLQTSSPLDSLQQPGGEPWIGDIKLGYDPNGADAVGHGGVLPLKPDGGTLYASFAWRNLRPGTVVTVERTFEEYAPARVEGPVRTADGQARFVVLNYTVPAHVWGTTWVKLVISMEGREMARAYVTLK